MGLQLPGELIELLSLLGYNWPQADEEKLYQMGQVWTEFSGQIHATVGELEPAAAGVWTQNAGGDVQAFQAAWTHEDGPSKVLQDGATAATLTGIGLMICAAIVLALKINIIVQLTILAVEIAEALATAAATFGASLLEIPVFQQLARTIIENLMQQVIFQLLDA
jgi:hypothetical protein